jgi:hypothetical protein
MAATGILPERSAMETTRFFIPDPDDGGFTRRKLVVLRQARIHSAFDPATGP